ERAFAAEPVADVPEQHRPDRSGQESDEERRERGERPDDTVAGGEEQLAEHDARRGAVEEEVVPLDRRAEQTGDQDGPMPAVPVRGPGGLTGHGRGHRAAAANGISDGCTRSWSPSGCDHSPRRRSSGSTPSPTQYASSRCGCPDRTNSSMPSAWYSSIRSVTSA